MRLISKGRTTLVCVESFDKTQPQARGPRDGVAIECWRGERALSLAVVDETRALAN